MFVCDFIITMKVCQGDIYALYFDLANNLTSFQFLTFNYFLEVNFFGLPMMRTMNLITKIETSHLKGMAKLFGPNTTINMINYSLDNQANVYNKVKSWWM